MNVIIFLMLIAASLSYTQLFSSKDGQGKINQFCFNLSNIFGIPYKHELRWRDIQKASAKNVDKL